MTDILVMFFSLIAVLPTLLLLSFTFLEDPVWLTVRLCIAFSTSAPSSLSHIWFVNFSAWNRHVNMLAVCGSLAPCLTVLSPTFECKECRQLAVFSNVKILTVMCRIQVVGVPFPLTSFPSSNPTEMRGRWRMISKKEGEIHINDRK